MPENWCICPSEKVYPSTFEIDYNVKGIFIIIKDTVDNSYNNLDIYVNPSAPLGAPSVGYNYEFTLNGESIDLFLPTLNWGTQRTLTANDSLIRSGTAYLKNKKTSQVIISSSAFSLPNENNYMFVGIPDYIDAGEYEITLERDQRKVVVPDAVILKYGEPRVRSIDYWDVRTYKQNDYTITYKGFNLLPGYAYELEVRNDFVGTKRLPLTPVNHLTMQYKLPGGFERGNYEVSLFVDNKEVKSLGLNSRMLYAKKDSLQSAIGVLSQLEHAVPGEITLYKAVTKFNRKEPIVVQFDEATWDDRLLLLKNVDTGVTYQLPMTGMTTAVYTFPYFAIIPDVSNGRYEVRASTRKEGEAENISERYHRIITIE